MSSRSWCGSCMKTRDVKTTELGHICCTKCGKVVAEDMFREEVQFTKGPSGQGGPSGSYVRIESEYSASRERTLHRAYEFIYEMVQNMGVGDGDFLAKPSVRFYEIAVEKNFVRGRRAEQVAAACLYIACREKNRPFLLIEFSEYLRVNVYVLGAVFLQLCKVLHLQEHTIVRKLVDPSLFIHRFAYGLLGEINHEVEKTALRIMTSMKRDWMQTGRKPSGLCGAALYISALSYGHKIPKTKVIKVVHICEATLNKRLIEFEGTESGSLTIEEFIQKAEEIENNVNQHTFIKGNMSKEGELLCEHKNSANTSHFAHGLCEDCYIEFIRISGGLDGGSEPPAFQRAERERLAKARAEGNAKNSLLDIEQAESSCINPAIENVTRADAGGVDQMKTTEAAIEHGVLDSLGGISGTADDLGMEGDESDNFSDIDDAEVDAYLHNEEETQYKKMIWEKVNWEYLEEQAQKAAAGLLNVPKPKKERQQKKTNGIAQTASEAAHQMLSKKRVSSKLNHDRLKELFDEPVVSDSPKRIRTESFPEKKNQGENDEDNEYYDEKKTYDDYQDDPYSYNEEEYEEFDDGLF
ncbi:transcription factor IIIB 60 kDa subunit-like [Silene latifolia]|uniref:transcription factor IIIB 60 kDa subunit-like n=1 Tax=Silene latifolia TaxID=37657 RepID=UPI003D76FE2A